MKVVCESCQAKYRIPEDRIAGKKLKIQCRKCNAMIVVRADLEDAAEKPATMERSARASTVPPSSTAASRAAVGGALRAPAAMASSVARTSAVVQSSAAYSAAPRLGSQTSSALPALSLKLVTAEVPQPVGIAASPAELPIPEEDATQSAYEWYASIDGEQHGPMDEPTLIQWLVTYPTAWDAHVWRDGLGDWLPARYLDNLVDKASLLVGADAVAEALQESARAAVADEEVGPDPTISLMPIAGEQLANNGYEEPSVAGDASVASPRLSSASAFTGARHEESVLFSAANLRKVASTSSPSWSKVSSSPSLAVASAPAASSAPPMSQPGFASGDGSGMVDIRALAAMARASSSPPEAATAKSLEAADSLFGVGLALPPLDSLAPVAQAATGSRRGGSKLPLAIVAGSALMAAAVVTMAVLVRTSSEAVEQDQVVAPAATAQAIEAPAATSITSGPAASALENPAASVAAVKAVSDESSEKSPQAVASVASSSPVATGRRRAGRHAKGDSPKAEAASAEGTSNEPKADAPAELEDALVASASSARQAPAESPSAPASVDDLMAGPEPAPAAAAAPTPKQPPKDRSIDELLDVAVSQPAGAKSPAAAAKAPAAASSGLSQQPSRDQVLVAMRGVTPSIQRCASQYGAVGSMAKVKFTIEGSSGAVSSTEVSGVGGSAAACIATAAKSAKFTPFQKPMFTVNFPFSL